MNVNTLKEILNKMFDFYEYSENTKKVMTNASDTISNFFAGDDDAYDDDSGNKKQAYSTYMEVGTYYDFLDNNRLSLAVGMTPNKSCYTNYQKKFAVCNLDLKYTYNVQFKNGWTLPLSAEYIYNPSFDKSYVNFIANFAF